MGWPRGQRTRRGFGRRPRGRLGGRPGAQPRTTGRGTLLGAPAAASAIDSGVTVRGGGAVPAHVSPTPPHRGVGKLLDVGRDGAPRGRSGGTRPTLARPSLPSGSAAGRALLSRWATGRALLSRSAAKGLKTGAWRHICLAISGEWHIRLATAGEWRICLATAGGVGPRGGSAWQRERSVHDSPNTGARAFATREN